jgi:uncharacterized OsmC-like protein
MKTIIKNQLNTQRKFIAALLLGILILNIHLAIAGNKMGEGNEKVKEKTNVQSTNQNQTIMETIKVKRINGFSPEDIVSTVQVLQNDPSLASFEFRVSNRWIAGGHNRSNIQGFYGAGQEDESRKKPFVHDNSEPPVLLGNNEGANPVEYILHGLAGCMTTTMVLHAAAHGIELESVESTLEGDLDVQGFLGLNDQVRNGYQQIRVNFTIKGNLSAEEKQQLESFVRMSPVFDIVTNKVPVQVALQY